MTTFMRFFIKIRFYKKKRPAKQKFNKLALLIDLHQGLNSNSLGVILARSFPSKDWSYVYTIHTKS